MDENEDKMPDKILPPEGVSQSQEKPEKKDPAKSEQKPNDPEKTEFSLFYDGLLFIMKLYMTICDFLFFLYLFSFTLNTSVVCFSRYGNRNTTIFIFKIIGMIPLGILFTKPLSLAFWECIDMSWFSEKMFASLQNVFNCLFLFKNGEKYERCFGFKVEEQKNITNILLIVIFFAYIILGGIALYYGWFVGFDIFHFIVIFFIPAIKFLLVFIMYIVYSVRSFLCCSARDDEFKNDENFKKFMYEQLKGDYIENSLLSNETNLFADRNKKKELDNIKTDSSLLINNSCDTIVQNDSSNAKVENEGTDAKVQADSSTKIKTDTNKKEEINPFIYFIDKQKGDFKDCNSIFSIIVIILSVVYLVVISIVVISEEKDAAPLFFFITFGLIFSLLLFAIKIPCCACIFSKNNENNNKEEGTHDTLYKLFKERSGFLVFSQYVFFLFEILLIVAVTLVIFVQKKAKMTHIFEDFNGNKTYNGNPFSEPIEKKNFILSPYCYTKVHYLSYLQLSSFAGFSYYDFDSTPPPKEQAISEFEYLKRNFFRQQGEGHQNLNLESAFLLADDISKPIILKAEIKVSDKEDENVIVYAMKGTSTGYDIIADVEMGISSSIYSFISSFPFLLMRDSYTNRYINKFITFPLKVMKEATVFGNYVKKIKKRLENDNDFSKVLVGNSNKKIIFTGHSLGGALSKIMGITYGFPSVAFSGFGVTPISHFFEDDYNSLYRTTMIDIVPDKDIIPRLDSSGGVRYRLLCGFGTLGCHSIKTTMCMIGLSCKDDFYVRELCHAFLDDKSFSTIEQLIKKDK